MVSDGHAKAGAAVALRGFYAFLLKRTENAVDEFRCHADAGIVHANHEVYMTCTPHHLAERDDNLALACEFYGV